MVKNLIGWVCLGVFLVACEQEDMHYTGESDTHRFSIPLSLASDLRIQEGTDYVPMVTKADDAIKTKIDNICQCLVLKQVGSKWYVEDLLRVTLDKSKSPYSTQEVTSDGNIGSIELTLRPGDYHVLVVTNPWGVKWNPDLISGYMVKDENNPASENKVPYAVTYYVESSSAYMNVGLRSLSKEIFTGTYSFTITKTGDLHSNPINENKKLHLTRKVSRFRILLKEVHSPNGKFVFDDTAHYIFPTLHATGDTPFCDGIDCWGEAYYNEQPTKDLPMCISTMGSGGAIIHDISYQLVLKNSTYPGVFVFTDDTKTEGIPYEISIESFTSNDVGYTYYYDGTIPDHTLYPNSIDGVVFQTTDEYRQVSEERESVKVQVLDENVVELLDPFYEVNR